MPNSAMMLWSCYAECNVHQNIKHSSGKCEDTEEGNHHSLDLFDTLSNVYIT